MYKCKFCPATLCPEWGFVDIGGLKMCPGCYTTRRDRTSLPCEVCGKSVQISPDPLTTGQCCSSCEQKADLCGAWDRAKVSGPCDRCGKIAAKHHPTVYGQCICGDCYSAKPTCTQVYPGDKGYPAFAHRPSLPALVLSKTTNPSDYVCVVCECWLLDPYDLGRKVGDMPTLCFDCPGQKWWSYMKAHYDELKGAS